MTQKNVPHSVSHITKIKRIITSLLFTSVLVLFIGYISHCTFNDPKDSQVDAEEPRVYEAPVFEIYPEEEISPFGRIPEPGVSLPRVAIIIDDMGYDLNMAEKLLSLDAPLTFSIFPHSPFQEAILSRAGEKEIETMLHLPMEPVEYPAVNPGPGALLTRMTPDQLILQLKKNLDALPSAKGVNNHMGSKMTTVSTHIYQILSVLKKRDLFFIDSLTTPHSLCKSTARLLQIPFAQRDVFLDHLLTPEVVRRQLKRLIRIANHYGEAVGIGHPHNVTYQAIREMLPELRKKVRLVPASEIVHTIG